MRRDPPHSQIGATTSVSSQKSSGKPLLIRRDGARASNTAPLPRFWTEVLCLVMPELAEVEWFRKQWDVGVGDRIVDIRLHPHNRVFRDNDIGSMRKNLLGEKLESSAARGKRMLFTFSGN